MSDHHYWVYIMSSRSRTLYIGFTSKLRHRIWQHKTDTYDGFSSTYKCHRLVYVELHDYVHNALARETQLKKWSRSKKIMLIERKNPIWVDLAQDWYPASGESPIQTP